MFTLVISLNFKKIWWHQKYLPALIKFVPINIFCNKIALNAPNNILKNPSLCFFASFLFVLVTAFINKLDF